MTAQVEQNRLALTFTLATQCFFNHTLHRMIGLGCRHDTFMTREQHTSRKTLSLVICNGFQQTKLFQMRNQRRHAVITQTAGVEARWCERRTQGVHLGQRRHVTRIAEVVGITATRQ